LSPFLNADDEFVMTTKTLTSMSDIHVDYYPASAEKSSHEPVSDDELVAFLMMNDNDDAHFVHGSTSVPVKAGNLVSFNGNVMHHTVVNSGSVKLLCPISVNSLLSVGTPRLLLCS